MYYLNKPKYYGWYSTVIDAQFVRYGTLDMVQYLTNTTLIDNKLPERYGNVVKNKEETSETSSREEKLLPIDIEAKRIAQLIEPAIKAFLVNSTQHLESELDVDNDKIPYHEPFARLTEEMGVKTPKRNRIDMLINGINRIIMGQLAPIKSHLSEASVDHRPRTEAFWFRGGIQPDARMIKKKLGKAESDKRKGIDEEYAFKEERAYEKYDRAIQIKGDSILQIRCDKMLSPFIENVADDEICRQGPVPKYNYATNNTGYPHFTQHGTNLPGHWTGSSGLFGHLSYVNSVNKNETLTNEATWSPDSEYADRARMILIKALISSFAVLLPNACYQGFSPLNDPTHPFCTQTVVSDGQKFKFCVVQLNKTALLDYDEGENLTTRNVCWHIPEQELYSSIDESGVHGFNSNVLETLIKFYLVEPTVSEYHIDNMDYLGPNKYVHNLKNTYNREYFTDRHLFVCSKRAKHMPKPDILAYQRIFMINHPEQMFMIGNREQPWFRMAQIDFRGREHWHPEFKQLDHFRSRQVKKFRKNKWDIYKKQVVPPLPEDHEDLD